MKAGVIELLSNQENDDVTVDRLLEISGRAPLETADAPSDGPEPALQIQNLSKRLSPDEIAAAIARYESGESARAIAADIGVAGSALVRLLREKGVVVKKTRVSLEKATRMAKQYEAGATMRELEARYKLSHGAVYRALHRVGVEMRESKPRRKNG